LVPLTNIKEHIIRQGDFNGDGRTDIMISPSGGPNLYDRYFCISNQNGTSFEFIKSSETGTTYDQGIDLYAYDNYYKDYLDDKGRI